MHFFLINCIVAPAIYSFQSLAQELQPETGFELFQILIM